MAILFILRIIKLSYQFAPISAIFLLKNHPALGDPLLVPYASSGWWLWPKTFTL